MGVPASLALTVQTGLAVNIAGTPLATAGQLPGTEGGVAAPAAGLLSLHLPPANTWLAGNLRAGRRLLNRERRNLLNSLSVPVQ